MPTCMFHNRQKAATPMLIYKKGFIQDLKIYIFVGSWGFSICLDTHGFFRIMFATFQHNSCRFYFPKGTTSKNIAYKFHNSHRKRKISSCRNMYRSCIGMVQFCICCWMCETFCGNFRLLVTSLPFLPTLSQSIHYDVHPTFLPHVPQFHQDLQFLIE